LNNHQKIYQKKSNNYKIKLEVKEVKYILINRMDLLINKHFYQLKYKKLHKISKNIKKLFSKLFNILKHHPINLKLQIQK